MRILFISWLVVLSSSRLFADSEIDETWLSGSRANKNTFDSGLALKRTKKMGIQTTFAGATGLVGLNADLNFAEDFAVSIGYGVSHGFQAFNIHVKESLGGKNFIPYFVGGYSRWYAHGREGGAHNTSPAFLADKFLSAHERRTGDFSKDIIYPGLGLQYLNIDGDWRGLGFFAETLFLVNLNDFLASATAGLGTIYYF